MRAKEVERILQERVRTTSTQPDWKSYVSIFSYEEVIPLVIKDNPLIVVHPGWQIFCDRNENGEWEQSKDYKKYLGNIMKDVRDSIRKGRTVLVYMDSHQRKETLDVVGNSKKIILIPTEYGHPNVDKDVLGITDSAFYRKLSNHVRRSKVCGEYFANESNAGCVDIVEGRLREENIKITRGPVYLV